jgi:hypothetical protein
VEDLVGKSLGGNGSEKGSMQARERRATANNYVSRHENNAYLDHLKEKNA